MATQLKGKYLLDSSITETKLANNAVTSGKINAQAVTAAKLGNDVTGDGLTGGTGVAIALNIDTAAGLKFDLSSPKKVQVNKGNGIDFSSNTVVVKPKTSDGIAVTVDGVSVDYDNSSLGIVSTKLAIKASGVTNDMLAGSIGDSKLSQITTANKVAASAVEDKFLRNDGADSTSGKLTAAGFDASSQKITSLADGTINSDAVNWGQLQTVATQGKVWKEALLYSGQLKDGAAGGIYGANVLVLSANLQAGDSITLNDGSSTETYVADTDFAVGGSIDATLVNLKTAVNAGAIAVSADTGLLDSLDAVNSVLVLWQDTIGQPTRVYGNAAAASRISILPVAKTYGGVAADLAALPTTDPAATNFGFSRAYASLVENETHMCRVNDSSYTFDNDANVWNMSGATSIPYAAKDAYGKVQIGDGIAVSSGIISVDAGNGIELTGSSPNKKVATKRDSTGGANLAKAIDVNANGVAVRVDDSSIEGDATTGQLKVKALGVTDGMLAGSISDSKLSTISTANKVSGSAIQLASNPGLLDSTGLKVKIKTAGGLVLDGDGLSLDMTTINAIKVEEHTLIADDITNKSFTLSATPAATGEVAMDIIGGVAQNNGTDFSVSGAVVSWTGLGLDGVLEAGEVLRMIYPI